MHFSASPRPKATCECHADSQKPGLRGQGVRRTLPSRTDPLCCRTGTDLSKVFALSRYALQSAECIDFMRRQFCCLVELLGEL